MPSRNTLKIDAPQSFYHLYARGASKQPIFLDSEDYDFFTRLFARYLSAQPAKNSVGLEYPHYACRLELLAYCLMGNHFHMLIYQEEGEAMSAFMRSLMTSYSRYFNRKYRRSGSLFESRYKASLVDQENYLEHISRYIHLNPRYWQRYAHSSLGYYFSVKPEWLKPEKIEAMFASKAEYLRFLKDYEEQKEILEELKYSLADS